VNTIYGHIGLNVKIVEQVLKIGNMIGSINVDNE